MSYGLRSIADFRVLAGVVGLGMRLLPRRIWSMTYVYPEGRIGDFTSLTYHSSGYVKVTYRSPHTSGEIVDVEHGVSFSRFKAYKALTGCRKPESIIRVRTVSSSNLEFRAMDLRYDITPVELRIEDVATL